jgi:rubrerythrin
MPYEDPMSSMPRPHGVSDGDRWECRKCRNVEFMVWEGPTPEPPCPVCGVPMVQRDLRE